MPNITTHSLTEAFSKSSYACFEAQTIIFEAKGNITREQRVEFAERYRQHRINNDNLEYWRKHIKLPEASDLPLDGFLQTVDNLILGAGGNPETIR